MIGLEIAAITITVINRMLALGDKTADIIQAAQDFEAVSAEEGPTLAKNI
jgi:hypothetical protein